jgi:hypothetical protein
VRRLTEPARHYEPRTDATPVHPRVRELPYRRAVTERVRGSGIAVVAAAALVVGCGLVGWWLAEHGVRLHLGRTVPITGRYHLHLSAWLLVPLLVAAGVWYGGPRLAARLRWPLLLLAGYLTAVGWAVALALVGGPDAIAHPLTPPWEYLAEVDRIDAMGVGAYLRTFTDFIVEDPGRPGWANHVAGHPPLITLLFVLLDRAGLAGPGWAAAACVAVGAAAVPAVLATVRLLAGDERARAAAPFVAAAPVALWVATSADAIIAGVAAAGIATLAYAAARTGAGAVLLAGVAGLLLGVTLMLSYGMVLLAPIALAVVIVLRGWRNAWAPLLAGVGGVLAVIGAFAAAGFWWLAAVGITAERVRLGEGWTDRPTLFFVFNNPAALAVAVGPAVVAALPLLLTRRERLAVPAAAALVAVGLAMLSNLSKGEVERIWLPYAVWLLPLAALLPRARGWLAAHLSWPIVIAAGTTLSW